MARPKKNETDTRKKAVSVYPTDGERARIEADAVAAGLSVSRYVLSLALREDIPARRSYRRPEVIVALTTAAKALETLAEAAARRPVEEAFEIDSKLLAIERQLARIGMSGRTSEENDGVYVSASSGAAIAVGDAGAAEASS